MPGVKRNTHTAVTVDAGAVAGVGAAMVAGLQNGGKLDWSIFTHKAKTKRK